MKARHRHPRTIAACTFGVVSASEVQLLPGADFRLQDGRFTDAPPFRITADIAARLIAQLEARETRFLIDYEHQTLATDESGQPAPAAGWASRFEWREGAGLFAVDVEWTERARAMIDAGEYKYLSPVFAFEVETGEITRLLHAGLTNFPAIDGMDELAARAAARFQMDDSEAPQEDASMNPALKKLLARLNLAEEATEEQLAAAVEKLADDHEVLVAAKAKPPEPDPAKYVPIGVVEELKTEVVALREAATDRDVQALVGQALEAGKLLPGQKEWAEKLGKSDIAALREYVDKAQPIAALKGTQTGGLPPKPEDLGDGELSEQQLAMCKAMGLDPEVYKKTAI